MSATDGRTSTSLARGLALLCALEDGEELGVTRLAARVGLEKSQVSRTLQALAGHGFVDRDPETLAYRLGWRVFALAASAGDRRLASAAPRFLAALVLRLGEGAHLSVLRGPDVLTVLSQPAAHAVQAVNWVGRTVPAACTSSGYALLLDHDGTALARVLPDARARRRRPRAPQSAEELEARVRAARVRGYAVADEEFEPGLVAVAAPVRDFRGGIVAAVNVSAPAFRFAQRVDEAGAEVQRAAAELSRELGFDDEDASMLERWPSRSSSSSDART